MEIRHGSHSLEVFPDPAGKSIAMVDDARTQSCLMVLRGKERLDIALALSPELAALVEQVGRLRTKEHIQMIATGVSGNPDPRPEDYWPVLQHRVIDEILASLDAVQALRTGTGDEGQNSQ